MRKIISILLILAFALHTTSELWIVVSFQINRDYIAKNLCVNRFDNIPLCKGSCYLQKQLSNNENEQKKLPDLKTKEIVLFCQSIYTRIPVRRQFFEKHIRFISRQQTLGESSYSKLVFRPPISDKVS